MAWLILSQTSCAFQMGVALMDDFLTLGTAIGQGLRLLLCAPGVEWWCALLSLISIQWKTADRALPGFIGTGRRM